MGYFFFSFSVLPCRFRLSVILYYYPRNEHTGHIRRVRLYRCKLYVVSCQL